jgi:hypothetical protein
LNELRALLDAIDRPVAFHRCLVDPAGSIGAALMLGQAIYWTKRTKDTDGWFWKTQAEWKDEVGISDSEQLTVRRSLRETVFWLEEKKGLPPKIYFKVDLDALSDVLCGIRPARENLSVEWIIKNCGASLDTLSKNSCERARKAGVKHEYVDYTEILRRDGLMCGVCRLPITRGLGMRGECLQFDHIVPIFANGPHTPENIQCSHASCNGSKGKREVANYPRKLQPVIRDNFAPCSQDTSEHPYTETTAETTASPPARAHAPTRSTKKPAETSPETAALLDRLEKCTDVEGSPVVLKRGREIAAAGRLLAAGYDVEDIAACFQEKLNRGGWRFNYPALEFVDQDIGEWLRNRKGHR